MENRKNKVQSHHTFWMMFSIFRNPSSLTEITCEEYATVTKTSNHLNEKQIQEKALEEFKAQKQNEYPHNVIAVRLFKTKEECQQARKQEKRKFALN